MPDRRTRDVVHVYMTDHKIQRRPEPREKRLAPLQETLPVIEDVQFLDPERSPSGDLGELYRVITVLRAGGGKNTVDRLKELLDKIKPSEPVPYIDLALGQLKLKRFEEAEQTLRALLNRRPEMHKIKEWLSYSLSGQNRKVEAIALLRQLLQQEKNNPEALYNQGLMILEIGDAREASRLFKEALALRPNMDAALFYLGHALILQKKDKEAIEYFKRALEVEPSNTNAYLEIGRAYYRTGKPEETIRYWKQGVKYAKAKKLLEKGLAELLEKRQKKG
jgi:tetratricopeptide (TPR) repeat protein